MSTLLKQVIFKNPFINMKTVIIYHQCVSENLNIKLYYLIYQILLFLYMKNICILNLY